MGPQTRASRFTYLLGHAYEVPIANLKMECRGWPETPLLLGRSGTQYVALVTELLQQEPHGPCIVEQGAPHPPKYSHVYLTI